ncbi:MAG: dodecin domain-containing protein [Candidatus Thorarchaeota archaeon]|nr:dodecin domain-containing protein [Candidatus Thorarchaeota archaeon]
MTVAKVIELVGSSEESFEDAVQNAVDTASDTIRNIHGLDVLDWTADVEDGEIVKYRANVKIAFRYEE